METSLSELRKKPMEFAKHISKVTNGFVNGQTIERYYELNRIWEFTSNPSWSWDRTDYRIKPEPKVVPFSMEDIVPGMYVKMKNQQSNWLVVGFGPDGVMVAAGDTCYSYANLSNSWLWSTDLKVWKPFHKVIKE